MTAMNAGRVVAGGIAAGIVINMVEGITNVAVLASLPRPRAAARAVTEGP